MTPMSPWLIADPMLVRLMLLQVYCFRASAAQRCSLPSPCWAPPSCRTTSTCTLPWSTHGMRSSALPCMHLHPARCLVLITVHITNRNEYSMKAQSLEGKPHAGAEKHAHCWGLQEDRRQAGVQDA